MWQPRIPHNQIASPRRHIHDLAPLYILREPVFGALVIKLRRSQPRIALLIERRDAAEAPLVGGGATTP